MILSETGCATVPFPDGQHRRGSRESAVGPFRGEFHAAAPATLALLGSAPLASTAGSRREWTGRWQFEREWPPGNAPHFVSNHSPGNAPRFVCNHPPENAPRFVSNHSTGHGALDLGNESSKRSNRNLEPAWDDRSPKSSRVRRHRHHLPATAAPALRPRRLRLAGLSQRQLRSSFETSSLPFSRARALPFLGPLKTKFSLRVRLSSSCATRQFQDPRGRLYLTSSRASRSTRPNSHTTAVRAESLRQSFVAAEALNSAKQGLANGDLELAR